MPQKLNDKQIKALLKKRDSGRFAIGNGLYFRISNVGTGFWVLRYTINKKRREMIIGKYGKQEGELSLSKASVKAIKIKAQIAEGIDPIAEKKRPSQVRIATVNDLAEDWLRNDIEKRVKHPQIP
ncbi:DUF4102 domain-containing protein [Shewanella sp. 202IG2-18]|uniref:Arm DNA-binding domain-containing protein n=1 Tax=Parashewanella hymeniacidonis TaxID=2807618 RepID=UPI001961681F|nr:Arm DNA-binding domain-containing protein [Parashewanella hymeniacidonis]MBM7073013.1 DUF4102 domain-containing protein [Parashewanella hymeniacidonis]